MHTVTRQIPDDDTGRRVSQVIPAPPQACDYTKFMGGVDRGDQFRAYHTCSRKTQFWWKKVLYFLMDIARVNGYIAYKEHYDAATTEDSDVSDVSDCPPASPKTLTHSQFVLSLGTELIDGYAGSSTHSQNKSFPATTSLVTSPQRFLVCIQRDADGVCTMTASLNQAE